MKARLAKEKTTYATLKKKYDIANKKNKEKQKAQQLKDKAKLTTRKGQGQKDISRNQEEGRQFDCEGH